MSIGEYQEFTNQQLGTIGDRGAQLDLGLKALDLNHDGNLDKVDNNKILYILTSILVSIILIPYPLITKNPFERHPLLCYYINNFIIAKMTRLWNEVPL